jgi:hypothetical protein
LKFFWDTVRHESSDHSKRRGLNKYTDLSKMKYGNIPFKKEISLNGVFLKTLKIFWDTDRHERSDHSKRRGISVDF